MRLGTTVGLGVLVGAGVLVGTVVSVGAGVEVIVGGSVGPAVGGTGRGVDHHDVERPQLVADPRQLGLDVGDRIIHYCVLGAAREVVARGVFQTRPAAPAASFSFE